jgi:dGTP triphosphohydrolase
LRQNLYRHYKVARMSAKATRIVTDLYTAFMGKGLGSLAGGCPAASYFLLLRQKKVTKEKATLHPRIPEV